MAGTEAIPGVRPVRARIRDDQEIEAKPGDLQDPRRIAADREIVATRGPQDPPKTWDDLEIEVLRTSSRQAGRTAALQTME